MSKKKKVFDVILHNPHLVRTSIQCKKNQSPRDSLNRGFTVYAFSFYPQASYAGEMHRLVLATVLS
jgi:hypothetical protein